MIHGFSVAFSFLFLALVSISTTHAQSCFDTDPVGDGWGWDGSKSCRVVSNSGNSAVSACVDTDPIGDGWGWNGTTSCRVDSMSSSTTANPGTCVDTDPVGDGWGWNGTASCQVSNNQTESTTSTSNVSLQDAIRAHLVGTWSCNSRFLEPQVFNSQAVQNGYFDNGCTANPSRRGITGSTCDVFWISGNFFTSYVHTDGRSGQTETQSAGYVFKENGSYDLLANHTVGGDFITTLSRTGNWNLGSNGHQLVIDGSPKSRIAFEVFNDVEYFSWYSSDESRVTCKKN